MRIWIASLAFLSVAGLIRADELNDSYAQLKDAEAKKDPDAVKKLAAEVSKLARAEEALPKPSDADALEAWKQRQEYAKQVDTFAEYALSTTALASTDPVKTVELVNQMLEQNSKSQYLSSCAPAYLTALGKQGVKQQIEGATKIANALPNSEDALYILASGYLSSSPDQAGRYATRLLTVMKSKAKPEGVSEADWDKRKTLMLGQGYYIAGATACTKSIWTDCDKDLRAALPYLGKEYTYLGPTYFYLGLSNYQLGKITGDRTKIQEGEKFSEQSAGIAGPMQQQAARNVAAMKQELAAPVRR
jgi:hypothetical protein